MAGDSFKTTDVSSSRNPEIKPGVTDASQASGASNVFSEFALAAYQSGVQRPVDSLKQLVGMEVAPVKADENLSGMMKVSNVVGSATGQILDFLILNKIASTAVGKVVSSAGKESLTAAVLAEGTVSRAATTSAAVGFVNGALLTPLQENESNFRRLGNGAIDAASFSALGSVSAKYAGKFGDNLLGRAGVAALSGIAGGATNSILDPISHGQAPEFSQVAETTFAWAAGGVIAGEGMRAVGKGLNLAGSQISRSFEFTLRVAPASETIDLVQSGKPQEQSHIGDPAEPIQEVKQKKAEVRPDAHERIAPLIETLSMREIADRGDLTQLNERLATYYPELEKAFPLPGEIESTETYVNYLTDKEFPWEMEQLLGKDGKVRGGLQYQILDVDGEKINKAGWLEHIWVKDGARSEGFGSALLEHVQNQIQKKGGDLTFWEFNNPDKMTPEEIEEDAKGGITTQDRVDYWAKRGAYVAVIPSTGELAFYAQPGMDGQQEVAYLSTAWKAPGGLDGQKISIDDYKKTMLAAHGTIVDVNEDPTVKHYIDQLNALPDTHLEFVRLSDYLEQRAKQLDLDHQEGSEDAAIRRNRWIGAGSAVPEVPPVAN